ncbi:coiled-coil domain-containing protein 42 homolog [Lampris incognitus]|uniref:coiled-coil domain-containing protein 42 homolog n=1 Tax=Lampris incognitus TaxID=2546036 RepID=UPI0024B4DC32|nr:coiled-coil domain-containing protein 42 homolog [Lampris incognitus]
MAVHSTEDYFRTANEEPLLPNVPVGESFLVTGAMPLLEKWKEVIEVDKELKARRKEFELRRGSLRQYRDEILMREEKLKESLLHFDRFLQENDAKRGRGAKKAEKEREIVLQREAEIERLKRECTVLEQRRQKLQRKVQRNTRYWNFLEQVFKIAKFEEVCELLGRFETLLITREQLRLRESEVQQQADSQRGALQRYTDQQSCLLLQKNNLLSQLQTKLDQTRSETLRWVPPPGIIT